MDKTGVCSGFSNVRFLDVRVFDLGGDFSCSGCSGFIGDIMTFCICHDKVDFVEKMWINMRESLWEICGKVYHKVVDKLVLHILRKSFALLHVHSGKISPRFAHGFNRGKWRVLHIIHRPYYYNY